MSGRLWQREKFLSTKAFKDLAEGIADTIGKKFNMVLVGGLAVAYHANPPVTLDVDFLVDTSIEDLDVAAWNFEFTGWKRRTLIFPHKAAGLPKRGVGLLKSSPRRVEIDLIASGDDWFLKSVVKRGTLVKVQPSLAISIVTPEDLIIMKRLVGREKDLDDVLALGKKLDATLDHAYIETTLNQLER